MDDRRLTRRGFAAIAAAASAAGARGAWGQTGGVTAAALVKRITDRIGVAAPDRSVDGFKAGDPGLTVQGVAVTAMATMAVLQQAAKARLNLVISLEPTFYGRTDGQPGATAQGPAGRTLAANDPLMASKRDFIKANGLTVYRLHDQWTGRAQNEHARALAAALGWTRPAAGGDAATDYEIAPLRLADLVPQVRARLKASGGLRVIGDPDTRVRRVTVMPGVQALAQLTAKLPSADLLLVGETRDWEGPEYVGDASTAGLNKGLITVGKVVSEDPGMRACADWLKGFVREAPVAWIAAGEPYWRPA